MKRLICLFLVACSSETKTDGGMTPDGGGGTETSTGSDGGMDAAPMCPPNTDFMTDKANCGACQHDCGGAECKAGVCQPITLVTIASLGYGIAVDDSPVYWTSPIAGVFS